MVSKPTRILALVLCLWVGAIAGIASDADPIGPQTAATTGNANLGIRIEGRGNLRIGSTARRPSRAAQG